MKGKHPRLPKEELARRHSAYLAHNKSIRAASKTLGITRRTLLDSLNTYEALPDKGGLEFPDFPSDDLPIERIIDSMAERSQLRRKSYEAHTWFPVKVKDEGPIGLMFFGDPHVDDDGCDWTLLKRDIAICNQPGIYGVNIGDTTNNWAGRLVSKYASQESSAKTAQRLAEWFMLDSGIKWLVFLQGNHDQWGDGASILAQMARRYGTHKLTLHDWEARFSLKFKNGADVNIWTAHDFPGDSQWNNLHGPLKAAKFGPDVDLFVCGHRHNWGVMQTELAEKDSSPTMIRVRGYKFNDDYARRIGKVEQKEGSGILVIVNPNAASRAGRVIPFVDVEQGANYLAFLRKGGKK